MKKRRGAGNRGGRGRAGSGKKAQAKKPMYWGQGHEDRSFGYRRKVKVRAVNISFIEEKLAAWERKGLAVKAGNGFEVDLEKAGFNKLLASGAPKTALTIKVRYASKGAGEKLAKAGGKLELSGAAD